MSGETFGSKGLMLVCAAIVAGAVAFSGSGMNFDSLVTTRKSLSGTETLSSAAAKPSGGNSNSAYPELSAIASNFDVKAELGPAWGTGAIPISNPDGGSFAYLCNSSQLRRDDPIEAAGAADTTDLHEFVGNTAANAASTYASLRTSGSSSCMSPVNRSAQWFPAMLNGRGYVVRPDYVSVLYQRYAAGDSRCGKRGKFCIPLPNGLRFSFGEALAATNAAKGPAAYFTCDGAGAVATKSTDMAAAAKGCPTGARLGVVVKSPSCWDGVNLDSADHRSHVAYPSSGLISGEKCPSSHPYNIPGFTMSVWYTTDDSLDRSGTWDPLKPTWHFSSDEKPGQPMSVPGSTFHAGWYGAWDNNVQAIWIGNCIDKKLVCSQGDLGNGQQIRSSWPFSWMASPRLVPDPYAKSVSKPTPVIADDGDSISVYWAGNWTGVYAASRSDEEFHGFAVGGSGIQSMNGRWPTLLASKPTVIIGMIGTNDLGNTMTFPNDQDYIDALAAYMDRARATGAKVVWGTIIARCDLTGDAAATFDRRRRVINDWLRGQVGTRLSALLPFDSDIRFGTITGFQTSGFTKDCVHPLDVTSGVNGYGRMADIAKPYIDAVVDGSTVPVVPAAAR